MNNYLNSVNYIMHTITDPFTNTKYLAKCMDNIRDNNFFNYVCTSTFLDTDKRPVEDSFDYATYLKIVIEFQIAYIRRILSYYKLPMEDREKYFNSNFLSNLDDTFIQEIKSITVDDLIAFNNRNRVRPVKTLSQLFPDKSERFTSFLIDLGRATSFDVEHARSSHFFGICCGGPYGETMPYTHRIYIYTEQDSLSRVLFLREYILKCIDAGINYDIKGKGSDDADAKYSKDSTVLYIEKVEDVPRVLKILDTIGKEHPEWINNFGSPLWNCGQLNGSYYSFGFGLSVKDNTRKDELGRSHLYGFETYNGVFDKYLREAYQIYLEKVSSMGKIDRQKRVALFQEILYEVKKQIQIKDYQTIYNLSLLEENKEAADSILHVREAYEKYGMRVRYNKNGCSNIITDCYVAHERELIRELVELYESVDKDKVDSPSVDIKNKK